MRFFFLFTLLIIGFEIESFAQKELIARKTSSPPIIDGIIQKNEWNVTDSAIQFIQLEPLKGAPASELTITFLLYDKKNLYFGFKCFDKDPSSIVANILTRDKVGPSEDAILILLDTYLDKRSAFAFAINSLGTQTDFRVGDDGSSFDINWDAQWLSAAQKTSWGWSAEIAIPFSSMSYDASLATWGINFGRVIRKNSETVYWSGSLNDNYRISQGGLLTNLELPVREHFFAITPYSTLRFEDSDLTGVHNKWRPDIGVDGFYRITSNLMANLTVNPDFATVEGDQEKINMTRWELRFPEKRLFFLEGNELFSTRIRTFYSRRIGDIDYGGKLTGKIKDYNISLIGVRSVADTANNEPAATFSVLRMKKDILKSSTLGVTIADKSWEEGFSRSFSTDYVLNLGNAWKLTGQVVGSFPGKLKTHSAYFVRVAKESNIYHIHVRYSDIGTNFRENVDKTGFVHDEDMKVIDSDLSYKWWLEKSIFKYINLSSRNNIFWSHQNTLRSWNVTESARFYFSNKFNIDFSYNNEFKLYEKKYYNHKYITELGYNTDEWASAKVNYSWGENYKSDFNRLQARVRVKPTKKMSLEYLLDKLEYSPDTNENSTTLNILIADYNFTRDLWIRVLAQNNSGNDRVYFYGLFGWRFQPPFGALYLIYLSDRMDIPLSNDQQESRIFFIKLSYQFGKRKKNR